MTRSPRKGVHSAPIGKHTTLKVNKVRSADMCYESQIKRILQPLHLQYILILFENPEHSRNPFHANDIRTQ